MGIEQVKELERLQKENECLRRAVSDLTLDKLILKVPIHTQGRFNDSYPGSLQGAGKLLEKSPLGEEANLELIG